MMDIKRSWIKKYQMMAILLVSLVIATDSFDLTKDITIGALIDDDNLMRRGFMAGIHALNRCSYVSGYCEDIQHCNASDCHEFHDVRFYPLDLQTDDDVLNASTTACDLFEKSTGTLVAVMGPHSGPTAFYQQGVCSNHDIAHVIIGRDADLRLGFDSINFYPDSEVLASWKKFSILFEETENFSIHKILKSKLPPEYERQLTFHPIGPGPTYVEALLRAKESGIKRILLDCSTKVLPVLLREAQEVGIVTNNYEFLITSLDLQTIDMRPYRYSGANITATRIIEPKSHLVRKFVGEHLEAWGVQKIEDLRTEEALMFDAVAFIGTALKRLLYQLESFKAQPITCYGNDVLNIGTSFKSYLKLEKINGLTGPLRIEDNGIRKEFSLDVISLRDGELVKIGEWADGEFNDAILARQLQQQHFKVLITLTEPYAMLVNNSKSLTGNDRFEGFVIDLIHELGKLLGFNYTFYVQEDADNGRYDNKTKQWTGMVGKILRNETDLAITDLTITKERASVVDFSTAFWNLGMSILYKRPKKAPPTMFTFLSTFHRDVWMFLGLAIIVVSLQLYMLGRISPAEWNNPYPCIQKPTELHNQLSFANSVWFTIGALMQQGSEIAPIGNSTRLIAATWWFFCLIMVSSYTANLAAVLTIESPVKIVKGIDDLYNQSDIKFGAKRGGSTYLYFLSSSNPAYRRLGEIMASDEWQKWMVDSNEEGKKLALTQNYAFLMESSSIEYIQERECDLEQAGGLIDHKSYAIAYRKEFPWHQKISQGISILQESLVIRNLHTKWWKEKKGAKCFGEKSSSNPKPMNFDQLMGVFLVSGAGIMIGCLYTCHQYCRSARIAANKAKVSFKDEITSEIKFLIDVKQVTKPVRHSQKKLNNCSLSQDNCSCNYSSKNNAKSTTQI